MAARPVVAGPGQCLLAAREMRERGLKGRRRCAAKEEDGKPGVDRIRVLP